MNNSTNRRRFFKLAVMSVASLPFLKFTKAFAEDNGCTNTDPTDDAVKNRMVKPDDAAAKRLDYVAHADDSEHDNYTKGELCKNCRFYRVQQEKEDWAPCTMLANRFVPACGWCRSYQPMPS